MNPVWGAAFAGLFTGLIIGYAICALMLIAKQSELDAELLQQSDENLYGTEPIGGNIDKRV